ncbi:MAG: glutamate racemase [Clostridia bacterium]|nr:glutamate racemase [Clostridia bacterium]
MALSDKPIGIFDSGLGGLTVVKAVLENMPNENIIYLGDSLNVPYGDKTSGQITEFAFNNTKFLLSKGVKAIAIACNTADATSRREILQCFDIPVVGVISPASERAARLTKNKKVGVIATATAVKSGAYERAVKSYLSDCQVFSEAAPALVPLIEAGKINKTDTETVDALSSYICPLIEKGIDTLVLGCTHYPLVLEIVKELFPDINIVCSGTSSLGALYDRLKGDNLLNVSGKKGEVRFYVTGEPSYFEKNGGLFLGTSIEGKVEKAVI